MSSTTLTGRVAVVTGASRGIGRAIALALASEGARVAATGTSGERLRSVAQDAERLGGQVLAVEADLRDSDAVSQLAATVEQQLGTPDVLVANAGVAGPTTPLWKLDPADWDDVLRVNLTGVFLCCRAFLPAMTARGSGSVVVVGSAAGKRPLHGRTPYAASKSALLGLVRTLAVELGPEGLRANLVSPGPVGGERMDAVVRTMAQRSARSEADVLAELTHDTPLRRFVEAGDVARVVTFLAGDAAGAITGQDLNVSNGWVMH